MAPGSSGNSSSGSNSSGSSGGSSSSGPASGRAALVTRGTQVASTLAWALGPAARRTRFRCAILTAL